MSALDVPHPDPATETHSLVVTAGSVRLPGDLTLPPGAHGLVVFAHGSGSSRLSVRNRAVANILAASGVATLLFDLLTAEEGSRRDLVFDIPLLTGRLEDVARWARSATLTQSLPVGLFGASTGAAAALGAAASMGDDIRAVVSRGGRPDLAADRLAQVRAPTLLIVGGADREVLALNRRAAERLGGPHRLAIIEGAGHLFEEPGALRRVADLAALWFGRYLPGAPDQS